MPAHPPVEEIFPTYSSLLRLRRLFVFDPSFAYHHVEQWIVRRMAAIGLAATRIAIGIIFLWFGLIKFLPNVLPIDVLAEKILTGITFHLFRPEACLHVLAFFECLIGIGMLTKRFVRTTVFLLFLQLPGTFLPLILLRHETWFRFPYLPTFEGQYIVKNFVLISAGLIVGATSRGGLIIAHPQVAAQALEVELEVETNEINRLDHLSGAPDNAGGAPGHQA